jgi:hypothetical protein
MNYDTKYRTLLLVINRVRKENTECPALNGYKTKHISATIKCTGEIGTSSNTGPHKVSYVLSRSQSGTISGTTHVKIIFNFSPATCRHFTGNGLCSSDNCHVTRSHFVLFHDKQCLINHPKKKSRGVKSGERGGGGVQGMGLPVPIQRLGNPLSRKH